MATVAIATTALVEVPMAVLALQDILASHSPQILAVTTDSAAMEPVLILILPLVALERAMLTVLAMAITTGEHHELQTVAIMD